MDFQVQLIVRFITGSCYQNSKREQHNFDSRCEPHVCRAAGTDLRLQTCPLQRQLCVCSGIKREATTYFCSDEIALVTTTATTTTKNRPVMAKPRVPLSASQNTAVVAAKRGRKVHKKTIHSRCTRRFAAAARGPLCSNKHLQLQQWNRGNVPQR